MQKAHKVLPAPAAKSSTRQSLSLAKIAFTLCSTAALASRLVSITVRLLHQVHQVLPAPAAKSTTWQSLSSILIAFTFC